MNRSRLIPVLLLLPLSSLSTVDASPTLGMGEKILKLGQKWEVKIDSPTNRESAFLIHIRTELTKLSDGNVMWLPPEKNAEPFSIYYAPKQFMPENFVATRFNEDMKWGSCIVINPSRSKDLTKFKGYYVTSDAQIYDFMLRNETKGLKSCTITLQK